MTACSTVFLTKFINVHLAKNSSYYETRNFTVPFSSLDHILGQIYKLSTSIRFVSYKILKKNIRAWNANFSDWIPPLRFTHSYVSTNFPLPDICYFSYLSSFYRLAFPSSLPDKSVLKSVMLYFLHQFVIFYRKTTCTVMATDIKLILLPIRDLLKKNPIFKQLLSVILIRL